MSVISKKYPVGIDFEIKRIQDHLYSKLTGYGWTKYDCYGRAFLNPNVNTGKNDIEVDTDTKNYQRITFNDKVNATSVFILSKDIDIINNGIANAKLSLIYMLNIKSLYSGISHRADEEAVTHIISAINTCSTKINLNTVKRGVDNVWQGLNVAESLREDLSEFCLLRFDFDMNFEYKNYC